ncbi:MAG: cation:proton antiporter [Thermoplasmata archaeon]|nr:MAG: cation:proton antiporter [Thermoplasmata archaeon]
MLAFIASFIFCLILWLALTFNGRMWGYDEILADIIFSIIGGAIVRKIFIKDYKLAKRFIFLIAYLPRFFYEMAKANFDVAYRVITGKIKPAIVKISPGLKSDLAITILANSITLTPGTLSVDVDDEKNLYVHWIYAKDDVLEKMPRDYKPICSTFPDWARRIGE